MHIQSRFISRVISIAIVTVAGSALLAGTHAGAQAKPARAQAPAPVAVPATPVQTERDVAGIQDQLVKLLRQSPTLTTVVARDPSLLSNQEYVAKNNPQLAAFLEAHPEVARNPDYYLFTHLNREGGSPDEALERAAWPDMYRAQRPRTGWDDLLGDMPPFFALSAFLLSAFWIIRMVVGSSRVDLQACKLEYSIVSPK